MTLIKPLITTDKNNQLNRSKTVLEKSQKKPKSRNPNYIYFDGISSLSYVFTHIPK